MFSNTYNNIISDTNGGLDLICECYPQARNVAVGKYFRIRDEKTPSAHIYKKDGVCLLKDFGGSAEKARDGIHVYADFNSLSVEEAVHTLASRLGLEGEKHNLGPEFSSSPAASDDYEEGRRWLEFKDRPTASELAFLAPEATAELLEEMGWKSVKCINTYKDGRLVTVSSTANFPIFAREMHDIDTGGLSGYKIYQPRSVEKKYKFSYCPSGMQPGNYWHGLYEAKRVMAKNNRKLDSVVICSGERDAIVVRSMGYYPVWANSETTPLNMAIYTELVGLAKKIYLIPDIDSTGREMGRKNMLAFPQIFVAWLPEEMKQNVSDQHKSCKDLRDWAQTHRCKRDFINLLTQARPYQFWTWNARKGTGDINEDYLLHFLEMNGFAKIYNRVTREYEFVREQNHIIRTVTTREMRDFIIESVAQQPAYIHNLVLKSRCTEQKRLEDISLREFDFTSSTDRSQIFFFGGKQFMVTADGISEIDEASKVYVREDKVSEHEVTLLPPQFTWEKTDMVDEGGTPVYKVVLPAEHHSCLLHYLILTSMIHWETYQATGQSTQDEDIEENRVLAVKLFHIGYMLHRKRIKSLDWAPIMMDYNTPLDAECANGGVGKSFLYQDVFPAAGYKVVKVRKQSKRPSECDFLYDQVTFDTDMVYFDECGKDFHFEDLNDAVTGDLVVNKKNRSQFTIPYASVPKFAFLTNYVPRDFDASSDRRHIYDVSSDYFHQKTLTNGYAETRTIRSVFGKSLMQDDYSAEDWNLDLNVLMQIEQFYLDVSRAGQKPVPPMSNIMKRHDCQLLDPVFDAWADSYYSNPAHLNTAIPIPDMLFDFNSSNLTYLKMDKKTLKKDVHMFANIHGLEFNPLDVCNDKKGHRIKYKEGNIQSEKIYLRGEYCE